MGMKYFCCGLCGIAVQKESSPGSNGCTNGSRNGGNHHWYDLGYAGSNNYSCSNCGVVVQTASSPLSWGCPNGSRNGGNHIWHKL